MPTFTDASLVAAGTGALLWAILAAEARPRRRTWAGLAGFAAIEIADLRPLHQHRGPRLRGRHRDRDLVAASRDIAAPHAGLVAGVGRRLRAALAIFDDLVYGGPLTTGYRLVRSPSASARSERICAPCPHISCRQCPCWCWAYWRWRGSSDGGRCCAGGSQAAAMARRDVWVGLAVGASWVAIWGLYSAYTWTTDPTNLTVQVVRFYLPALGAISLLGAWLVTRTPGRTWLRGLTSTAVIATLFGLGVWAFHAMYAAFGVPLTGQR